MTYETASIAAPAASRAAWTEPGEDPGVGVEHPAPVGLELEDFGEIFRRVHTTELLDGRLADREARTGVVIALPLELAEDRLEPLGSLGVVCRDPMIDHPAVRE